jgi:hypothetical protein
MVPLTAALVVHAAVTWALVGLIWTIQVVHYPLLAGLDRAAYPTWQRRHMTRITVVVAPLMVVEALAAVVALVFALGEAGGPQLPWLWVGLALLVGIWLSTALVQAPIHGRLAGGFDPALHRRLVRTNWVRTLLWTARGAVAAVLLVA